MADISNRCPTCGRMHPVFATGLVTRHGSDRMLVYEGYAPPGKPFRYKPSKLCMMDRLGGTRNQLGKQPVVGKQLTAWLVAENERR